MVGMWNTQSSHSLLVEIQMVPPFWKTIPSYLKNETLLQFNSSIPLLSSFPKINWKFVYTRKYVWMFVAALLIITKTWKSPSVPLVDEWINNHSDKGILFHSKKIELASVERRLHILSCKYCYLHMLIHDYWVLSDSWGNQEHLKTKPDPEQGHKPLKS